MKTKEDYINYANKNFKGKALELVLNNIELFYDDTVINKKNKYSIGEDVFLKKGTFMHGIREGFGEFEWIVDNGFISTDFSENAIPRQNKIKNSVGVWNIKEDMMLKDYIIDYSGFTIICKKGRGLEAYQESFLIPYHKFDEITEKINDDPETYIWWGDKTKEVTYLPSLVSNKSQVAFILNSYGDVWNTELEAETLEKFLDNRYYPKFVDLRFNKDASTTDRESAIMFGLPSKLIEGVLVGRKFENDPESLNKIKNKLPDCYICNVDGKVIVGNK
jgi:hypothetical protein